MRYWDSWFAVLAALSGPSVVLVCTPLSFARVLVVDQSHAARSDANPGTEDRPLETINQAASLAEPGDSVLVHGGTYRERVSPARGGTKGHPIVYTAAPGEQAVIKGSDVWRPDWQRRIEGKPIYSARLKASLFTGLRINPYRTLLKQAPGGQRLTLGQLFLDGRPLIEVDDANVLTSRPGSWRVVKGNDEIWIHLPAGIETPADCVIELTTRERIFAPMRRGLGYIHVIGFTMEHCANQFPDRFWTSDSPQAGALSCRAGHDWLIQGNTVRFAKSIGIDCGYEGRHDLEGNQPTPQNTGHHTIRDNIVTDNGCCGIAGMRSLETVITGNVIERNNRLRHYAPEIGGIKLHYFIGGRIEGNVIRNNAAHGIWLDNVYRNSRVRRNLVLANRGNGVFIELGQGPLLVDHNVIGETRPGFHPKDARGDGFYTHDASGITFAHNLVYDSHRFGSFHTKATDRRGAGVSRIHLLNNVFVNNHKGHINLPYTAPDAQNNLSNHNLFGPRQGEYVVNPWGGVAPKRLIDLIEESVGERPLLWNKAACRLNFQNWKRVTGWDQESVECELADVRMSDNGMLTVPFDSAAGKVTVMPVERVDRDFFGDPIVAKDAVVGPFQQWKSRKSFTVIQ
ncbi:MAG: right-handed parallel beta-helix repeat-containing protein [Planctomycetales bacterium]|nr:right-handed parallel beta-helix repeat-containing protein [Planctomycetales bacterium]